MRSSDFGVTDDPSRSAAEDVGPYRGMSPQERYRKFLDLMSFLERAWRSIEPARRARYDRANAELDRVERWWERVPRR